MANGNNKQHKNGTSGRCHGTMRLQQEQVMTAGNHFKTWQYPASAVVGALLLWYIWVQQSYREAAALLQISDWFSSGNTMFSDGLHHRFWEKNVMAMATTNQEKWKYFWINRWQMATASNIKTVHQDQLSWCNEMATRTSGNSRKTFWTMTILSMWSSVALLLAQWGAAIKQGSSSVVTDFWLV